MKISLIFVKLVLAAIVIAVLLPFYNQYRRETLRWQGLKSHVEQEVAGFAGQASIVIKDLNKGWAIDIEGNERLPAASLTKVPVMACCFEEISKGNLDPEMVYTLKQKDKTGGSGVLKNRPNGTKINTMELVELMIARSDNTASNILINHFGFEYLNRYFLQLELRDTNIVRLMMDLKSRDSGIENYTSAADMALLLERFYRGLFISGEVSKQCLDMLKLVVYRDRIPARLPSEIVVAHKTGLEKRVCHDVGIVYTPKGDFIICVLTMHNNRNAWPSKEFISRVSKLVYDYFA